MLEEGSVACMVLSPQESQQTCKATPQISEEYTLLTACTISHWGTMNQLWKCQKKLKMEIFAVSMLTEVSYIQAKECSLLTSSYIVLVPLLATTESTKVRRKEKLFSRLGAEGIISDIYSIRCSCDTV